LKNPKLVVLLFLVSLVILVSVNVASAQLNAINSGYAVTTNYHGIVVPPETPVTATAVTTNLDVYEVKFRWLRPNGTVAWLDSVTEHVDKQWEGKTIRVFNDTQTPDEDGDWGVQAIFYDGNGHGVGPVPEQPEKVAIRATSFNVIPDFPIIGTAGAVIAMLFSLNLFLHKKRQ
jgi:hypothetical protein